MYESLFLICFKNPFIKYPFIFARYQDKSYLLDDVTTLSFYKSIVSFGIEEIIETLRIKEIKLKGIVYDVPLAIKLLTGEPKSEYKSGNEPWALKNIIGQNTKNSETIIWLDNLIKLKTDSPQSDKSFTEILIELMDSFEKCWDKINEVLKECGDYNRYYDLEIPIYNLF